MLHSGLPDVERAREWWRVRNGEARVVVGTRSAVFAPLENLGLIIVDEEQESSYKQEETPRYTAATSPSSRALEGAVALLGSATPSLETYHNARTGKYDLLTLASRVENRPLADVEIVDLREEFRSQHRAAPVSETLRAAIALAPRRRHAGAGAHQSPRLFLVAALPQLRRVRAVRELQHLAHLSQSAAAPRMPLLRLFASPAEAMSEVQARSTSIFSAKAPSISRNICASNFPAPHRASRPRYRAHQARVPASARRIRATAKSTFWSARKWSPRATISSASRWSAWSPPISPLGRPDFRAAERTFQLLTQVAGRAGRGELAGEVLVETYYPEHYAIQYAVRQDYVSFFEKEVHFRRMLHYPPFTALANVIVRDTKSRERHSLVARSRKLFRAVRGERRKNSWPRRRAARAPAPRLPLPVCAEVAAPRRAGKSLNGCLDFCASKEIPDTAVIVDVDPASLS